jgi:copper chaperone CopZ
VGVFLLAASAEALVWSRRRVQQKIEEGGILQAPGWRGRGLRVPLSLLLYAAHLSVGYFIMLVTMMYQSELFVMVVLGLSTGHASFNMGQPIGESVDPCCQHGKVESKEAVEKAKPRARQVIATHGDGDGDGDGGGDGDGVTVVLTVEGMTCAEQCGATVAAALRAVPGVREAAVSVPLQRATVRGTAATRALLEAVQAVGFECRECHAAAAGGAALALAPTERPASAQSLEGVLVSAK